MPLERIRDYLQTQGLKLAADDVRAAYLAAQAVMSAGQAAIERDVLWYANDEAELARHVAENAENERALRQVFMTLDSAFERARAQSAVVYAVGKGNDGEAFLLRLAQQGRVLEQKIPLNGETGRDYLAARTAQTGWLNLADDVLRWLEYEETGGAHNRRSRSQMSLPVCSGTGRVLGVVHVEAAEEAAFDGAAQTEWVALAVALAEPLRVLLGADDGEQGKEVS